MGKMANRPTNQPADIPALKVDTKSADGKITNRLTNQPADVPLMKVDNGCFLKSAPENGLT